MKKLSIGVVITNGTMFLAVHPTYSPTLDIPKGMIEAGETKMNTLIREVKEETNIDLTKYKSMLVPMGLYPYSIEKNVYIYLLVLNDLPSISDMKCTSTFHYKQTELPEIDNYVYKKVGNFNNFKHPMRVILQDVFSYLKNNK